MSLPMHHRRLLISQRDQTSYSTWRRSRKQSCTLDTKRAPPPPDFRARWSRSALFNFLSYILFMFDSWVLLLAIYLAGHCWHCWALCPSLSLNFAEQSPSSSRRLLLYLTHRSVGSVSARLTPPSATTTHSRPWQDAIQFQNVGEIWIWLIVAGFSDGLLARGAVWLGALHERCFWYSWRPRSFQSSIMHQCWPAFWSLHQKHLLFNKKAYSALPKQKFLLFETFHYFLPVYFCLFYSIQSLHVWTRCSSP